MLVDRDHLEVCKALAITSGVLRKVRLRQNIQVYLAIFKEKDKSVRYLTHSKVTDIIWKTVTIVYPDISKKDPMMYSCHSIRVWACVRLDEALKESAKTAVDLIRFIHNTDSAQLLDEYIREMGEYYQGD